jgi:hypothetical protein
MLPRYAHRFGDGGFKRLMDEGVYFADVHYEHLTTFTAVGHATLFTGGGPAQHGIAGNDWTDPQTGKQIHCCEDDRGAVLGKTPKPNDGTGPRNLTSTTTGDEMVLPTAGRAKSFSVSIKDRAAILPGGHRGKAFWYDKDTGRFVTSSYYYPGIPRGRQSGTTPSTRKSSSTRSGRCCMTRRPTLSPTKTTAGSSGRSKTWAARSRTRSATRRCRTFTPRSASRRKATS